MVTTNKYFDVNQNFSSQLSDSDTNELYRIGNKRTFAKNDFIFRAGDFDANVWILIQGRVKIFKSSAQGRDLLLWFTTKGDIFGVAECMHEGSRLVSALASESCELLSVPQPLFKEWVIARPLIAYYLTQITEGRLREIELRFLSRANGNIQREVSQLILSLGLRYGTQVGAETHVGIPLTEQDIADMAGISRQGVSSFLADIKRQGIIECAHHFMVIKKLGKLKQLAGQEKTEKVIRSTHGSDHVGLVDMDTL